MYIVYTTYGETVSFLDNEPATTSTIDILINVNMFE